MKKFIALAFFVFVSSIGFSQTFTDFSTDPTKFLEEICDYINVTKRDDCKAEADALKTNWPLFTSGEQDALIDMANIMHAKKQLTYPYYYDFVRCINDVQRGKIPAGIFDSWQLLAHELLNSVKTATNKSYQSFLEFSHGLFTNNEIYSSPSHSWKSSTNEYGFIYLDNKPALRIDALDLFGITDGDTITIQNTSGTYYFMNNLWVGELGKTNWTRAGIDESKAYIMFSGYKINCIQTDFTIDSALLYYLPFSSGNMKGKYSDRLVQKNKTETSSYPRFESYNHHIAVDNLSTTISYVGGLTFEGSKIFGKGSADQKAVMKFERYDGKTGLIVRANIFDIKKYEDILASDAQITIMLGTDSIYHAGCNFKYKISQNRTFINRGDNGVAKSPFYDSYHMHEIQADQIKWNLDEPLIQIRNVAGTGGTDAYFESVDYFEPNRLYKYQNIADYNIIGKIKTYCDEHDSTREIYGADLAKYIKPTFTLDIIRSTLYKLCEDGFIYYDDAKDIITVRNKVFKYTMADRKKVDYDDIKIISKSDSLYATIDLTSFNMDVSGVKNLILSDSNFVMLFPKNDSVTIQKNRDMLFSGMMFAGRWDLYGRGFNLHYADFNIGLTKLDSIVINIPRNNDKDKYGNPILVPLRSTIVDATGTLQIDSKYNKSGKIKNTRYPSLKTEAPSYIFYDQRGPYASLYDRQKFFYEVSPFKYDSLNTFSTARMRFSGRLVSAGIFPDITERVRVQDDLSLGFQTTREGLPMYGGLGNFSDTINIDNTGLRGKGTFKFLTSTSVSNDIFFMPELMLANVQSFKMKKQVYNGIDYPSITGTNDFTRWSPYRDSMWIKMKNDKFILFDSLATLTGDVFLTSKGSGSSGTVDWKDAKMYSSNIKFGGYMMDADTSDFSIKSIDSTKFALTTHNVSAHIDFEKRIGDFHSNTDDIATEFPYNQYRTSMSDFHWDMDKKLITFNAEEGSESYFTSIHPQQDSLRFIGSTAIYNLSTFLLQVDGVERISVVDAEIFPDTQRVYIQPNAVMRQLKNATINADTLNGYHHFYHCLVNVYGKQLFNAKGDYDFNANDVPVQTLHFDEIGVYKDDQKNLRTYAKTKADTSDHLYILNKVQFKGNVNLKAPNENLNFDGYAKLDLQNPNIKAEWFSVNNDFNKDSSVIYYNNPQNEMKRFVTTGIVFASDSSELYTSFFTPKRSNGDRNIFIANGIVYYDKNSSTFIAGDKNKIQNGDSRGNVLTYNDATGDVNAEGKMDMGLNFGYADLKAAGTITTNIGKENDYNFNLTMGLNFPMDKGLLEMMAKDLTDNNMDAETVDYFADEFQKPIVEFFPQKDEKKILDAVNKDGMLKKSNDFPYTFFFTNLNLKWDKTLKIFYSTGPIGVCFIGEKNVNVEVPGYIEFGYKHGTADFMNLLLKFGEEDYFYLYYQNNILQVLTSDKLFNVAFAAIDPEKRHYKTDDNTKSYAYTTGSEIKMKNFVNRMKFFEEGGKK